MSDKRPQPTATLIKRLQRVAKFLDSRTVDVDGDAYPSAQWRARANTCWQAAARLEELQPVNIRPSTATTPETRDDGQEPA